MTYAAWYSTCSVVCLANIYSKILPRKWKRFAASNIDGRHMWSGMQRSNLLVGSTPLRECVFHRDYRIVGH